MKVEINVNQPVKVKLKDLGIVILQEQHTDTQLKIHPNDMSKRRPFNIKIDEDGYTSFQLWDLMNKFGYFMSLGREIPFEGNLLFEEFAKVIEEETK